MLIILGALLGLGIHIGIIWLDSIIIENLKANQLLKASNWLAEI